MLLLYIGSQAEYDDDLKNHLQYGKKNALYVSKMIQNDIIGIIGDNS